MQPQDYQDLQNFKDFIYQNYQDYRIIQKNAIFLHGIPQRYASQQELSRSLSNYGTITKISIRFLNKNFYSGFVQYENQISACLAICALDGLYLENRTIRAGFSSTKICPNFLKGTQCLMADCNYAHYYFAELTYLKEFAKQFNHFALAYNIIWCNYEQTLLLVLQTQQYNDFFPSSISKLKQILIFKSQELAKWEKQVYQNLQILDRHINAGKNYKNSLKSQFFGKEKNKSTQVDEWMNIQDQISTYIQQQDPWKSQKVSEKDKMKLKQSLKEKSLTKIQTFLEQTQKTLMDLIFKSEMLNIQSIAIASV